MVSSSSRVIYSSLRDKYEHEDSLTISNISKLLGLGLLVSIVIGSLADPSTESAIRFYRYRSWICITTGIRPTACCLLILIVRPFKIGDRVDIVGVTGSVSNIRAFFVVIKKDDGIVLIPNNKVLSSNILKFKSI